MFKYLVISIHRRFLVYLLLIDILLALGGGYSGSKVMTQGIVMSAQEDLEQYWRWQYDILVYPKESQEYQGLGDGWVALQTNLASYGVISLEDWKTIKQIPGGEAGVSDKNKSIPQYLRTPNKLMIVAVDPQAEESLYRLSGAIVEGEDLLFAEVVQNQALNRPVISVIALHDLGIQA